MAVYELNRIELYREVFVWAYEKSCGQYSQVKKEIGEPDPFRVRYRDEIKIIIFEIVRGCLNKIQAVAAIKKRAKEIAPEPHHERFLELVEILLMSLNSGNIVPFNIKLPDYEKWKETWQ